MRILDARMMTVREELTLHEDGNGRRFIRKGGVHLCGEDNDTKARAYDFAIDAGSLLKPGANVAWIGAGLCVGPRLFALTGCTQRVFEIEQAFEEFCPDDIKFIGGDWRANLVGKFDVIVYDLGGPTPRDILAQHLNPNGIILPKED